MLTEKSAEMIFSARYWGDVTFAFDNVDDYDLIEKKLRIIEKYHKHGNVKFYVLCGFKGNGIQEVEDTFKRIELLRRYRCLPYIMRYRGPDGIRPTDTGEYAGIFTALARWCNQPAYCKKQSLWEYAYITDQKAIRTPGKLCAPARALEHLKSTYPAIHDRYVYARFGE